MLPRPYNASELTNGLSLITELSSYNLTVSVNGSEVGIHLLQSPPIDWILPFVVYRVEALAAAGHYSCKPKIEPEVCECNALLPGLYPT